LLLRLVDKSLVVADKPEGETRFRMLEMIRQYSRDKLLESGEAETLRACHLNFFLNFAEGAEPRLRGADQSVWLDRVDAEHDNLRAALEWSSESGREQDALRLAAALGPFWEARGYFGDSRVWLEKMVAATPDAPAPVRAKALFGLGRLDRFQGRYAEAQSHLEESLARFLELGDKHQIASALQTLGEVVAEQGDVGAAQQRFAEALPIFRESADRAGMAGLLLSQGEIARVQGDHERAAALYLQALALAQQIGDHRRQMIVLYNLGQVTLHQGDPVRAAALFRNSLTLAQTLTNKLAIAHCVAALAGAAGASGQLERAARLSGTAEALFASIGARMDLADRLQYDRSLAAVRGLLNEKGFAAASAEGRAMSMEQAIEYAQEEPAD
jgi:non-specific serine/threonine protein kinase